MIKRTLFFVAAAGIVACSNTEKTETIIADVITTPLTDSTNITSEQEIAQNATKFEENEASFKKFTEYFKNLILANDTTAIKTFNKSEYAIKDLMFEFFIDTVGLVDRTSAFTDDMGYEYSSNYSGTEDGEEYESAIIYYFKYNKEKSSFELTNMLAAG